MLSWELLYLILLDLLGGDGYDNNALRAVYRSQVKHREMRLPQLRRKLCTRAVAKHVHRNQEKSRDGQDNPALSDQGRITVRKTRTLDISTESLPRCDVLG